MPKSSSASPTPSVRSFSRLSPRGLRRALQHGLLDLEPQPPRGKTARAQAVGDQRRAGRAGRAGGAERLTQTVGPSSSTPNAGRALVAGLHQRPGADLDDQRRLLGDRDEVGRRRHHAARAVPAQQRLVADDRRSESRTIGWKASRSCPSESARSSAAAVRSRSRACRRRRRVEDLHAPAALGLGAVGGGVGVGQQRVGVAAARGAQRDPDAAPRAGARCPSTSSGSLIASVRRCRARSRCARRCPRRRRRTRRRRAARRCPPGARSRPAAGQRDQQRVARRVAVEVVDAP